MKILIPALGRINTQNRDGGEIHLINVIKILQKRGFSFRFFLSPREQKLLKIEGVKASFQIIPEKITYEGENLFFILIIYFLRLWKAFFTKPPKDINLIFIPSDFLIDLIPGLWWKKYCPKVKIVVCLFLVAQNPLKNCQLSFQKKYSWPIIRSFLFYFTQKTSLYLIKLFADHVLVLNKLDKNILEKQGLQGKISVINMGVNQKEFTSIPNQKKKYDACFIGRLHPQKGFLDLIDIWKFVCRKKSQAKLVIIGGGSLQYHQKIRSLIQKNKLQNNILFLGFKTGKEKITILKQARLFILPSYYESWATVAIEAMAGGLPVIAYDLPIFPGIFHQGMIRVPLGNKEKFSQQVLKLLTDQNLFRKIKNQTIKQAKVYSWEKVASKEAKIFQNLLCSTKKS